MIGGDCIGLRETIAGKRAIISPSESISALSEMLREIMLRSCYEEFYAYTVTERQRHDIADPAKSLVRLIAECSESQHPKIVNP